MELDQLYKNRRSVRSYASAEITEEEIKEIISASQFAPSWKNSQTARYYVANTPEMIEAVKACLAPFNQTSANNAKLVVCSFKKGLSGKLNATDMAEEGDYWGAYDLGLNNAYFVLKAKEMGYDTLIMGIRDVEGLRKLFSIDEDEMILPVIALGKGVGEPVFRPRKETEEILVIK